MNTLALWTIGFYQRHISPHKGFRCAHAGYYGGTSCSHAVKAIVQTQGLLSSLPAIRARFKECRYAYTQLSSAKLALSTGVFSIQSEDEEERKRELTCFGLELGCDSLSACDSLPSACGDAHHFCSCWPSS